MRTMVAQMQFLSVEERSDAVSPLFDICDFVIVPPSLWEERQNISDQEAPQIFHKFQDAFDAQAGRTLLLGTPGSGKTTTLFQFACTMAQASLQDPTQPIPLVRSVHNWDHETSLSDWALVPIKEKLPGIDFNHRPILYIFDGLDELGGERPIDPTMPDGKKYDPRIKFLQAVTEQLPPDAQIVISSREADYNQIGEKAALYGAVKLMPLEPEQIEIFLRNKKQPMLWNSLVADGNLLALAQNPLILYMLSGAVGKSDNLSPKDTSSLDSNTIFDFYIRKMFEHEAKKGQKREITFTEAITRNRLSRLGAAMWEGWSPSVAMSTENIQRFIGEDYQDFIKQACDMLFLRLYDNEVQFIHLKFRDFCAVPSLIVALKDTDRSVRHRAATSLGTIGDIRAVPALAESLEDDDWYVRQSVAEALGQIGAAAVPAVSALVISLKEDEDPTVRRVVAQALGQIGDSSAVPALIATLENRDSTVRLAAIKALGQIKDSSAVPALTNALGDRDSTVRQAAAQSLINVGAPAVPALIAALGDQRPTARLVVAQALGQIKDTSAVPALTNALEDKDQDVRRAAIKALGQIGDSSAVPALIAALEDQNQGVRRTAAQALGQIGDTSAVPALTNALEDEDPTVRRAAVEALDQIKDTSAVPALTKALRSRDSTVRQAAAQTLGQIKDSSAVPALTNALEDKDQDVRRAATKALDQIKDTSAVPTLIGLSTRRFSGWF